jgi:hypothetical protein
MSFTRQDQAALVLRDVSGVWLARRKIMNESFWGKKKDKRSRVVHLLANDYFFGMYAAKCKGVLVRKVETQHVSDEQLVHFLRCKRCLAEVVKEESRQ